MKIIKNIKPQTTQKMTISQKVKKVKQQKMAIKIKTINGEHKTLNVAKHMFENDKVVPKISEIKGSAGKENYMAVRYVKRENA